METLEVIDLWAYTRLISVISEPWVGATLNHKTVLIESLCTLFTNVWSDSRVGQWVSWFSFPVSDDPSFGDLSHAIWSFHSESIERVTVRIHRVFRFRLGLNRTIAPDITGIGWEVSAHASLVIVHCAHSVSSLSIAWYTATQINIFHEVEGLPTVVVTARELSTIRLVFASKSVLCFSRKVKVSK